MIAAHISTREEQEGRAVTMLALTRQERIQLRGLLEKVLESVEAEKRKTGLTELAFQTERIAREFRRRL